MASAVDGRWFGWKVLRGFQPDGAVLELYTGVSPENQAAASFCPRKLI